MRRTLALGQGDWRRGWQPMTQMTPGVRPNNEPRQGRFDRCVNPAGAHHGLAQTAHSTRKARQDESANSRRLQLPAFAFALTSPAV